MGSRAVVIVGKNEEAISKAFGIAGEGIGTVYTRTGRAFFNDKATEQVLLARLNEALVTSGFYDAFDTDWVCLDTELMPWSAKAQALLQTQYAAVGSAALSSFLSAPCVCSPSLRSRPGSFPLQGSVPPLLLSAATPRWSSWRPAKPAAVCFNPIFMLIKNIEAKIRLATVTALASLVCSVMICGIREPETGDMFSVNDEQTGKNIAKAIIRSHVAGEPNHQKRSFYKTIAKRIVEGYHLNISEKQDQKALPQVKPRVLKRGKGL